MLVTYCRLCRHCHSLAEGGCLLLRFHFTRCRYFLGHVACRNLPWEGLKVKSIKFFRLQPGDREKWFKIGSLPDYPGELTALQKSVKFGDFAEPYYRISSPISRDPDFQGLYARLKLPKKKVKPSAISRERNY